MKQTIVRFALLAAGLALALSGLMPLFRVAKAESAAVEVKLDAASARPRAVEDTTEKAIVRDYSAAWKAIAQGLSDNDTSALDAGLVGFARDQYAAAIAGQKQSGVKLRYTDQGHQLEAVFYSPDGSAMQLRDTAKLIREVLDGDQVISREEVTARYLALMTVVEDRWKLRAIQEVPSF